MRRWRGTSAIGDWITYCMNVMEWMYVPENIKINKKSGIMPLNFNITTKSKNKIFRLVVRIEIPCVFLFCERVGTECRAFLSYGSNTITKIRVFFFLRNGSERNSELFFIFRGMGSERNSERFSFRETDGIPTEWIKICVCSVFSGKLFSQKMATLAPSPPQPARDKDSALAKYSQADSGPGKPIAKDHWTIFLYSMCIAL